MLFVKNGRVGKAVNFVCRFWVFFSPFLLCVPFLIRFLTFFLAIEPLEPYNKDAILKH